MDGDEEQVEIDDYLNKTYGSQTDKCSLVNIERAMDFTGYISTYLTINVMLELFEVTCGKQWCESKWTSWAAAGKSVWWLWTVIDKHNKVTLCNWYLRSIRTLRG